jgi:hypothetical protein
MIIRLKITAGHWPAVILSRMTGQIFYMTDQIRINQRDVWDTE